MFRNVQVPNIVVLFVISKRNKMYKIVFPVFTVPFSSSACSSQPLSTYPALTESERWQLEQINHGTSTSGGFLQDKRQKT